MLRHSPVLLTALLALSAQNVCLAKDVLVFSKVQEGAYRHTSIPFGVAALQAIGKQRGWHVDVTTDSSAFNEKTLGKYGVVVWNNTGGVVLDDDQRHAFQEFIRHGGGYAGVHMAAPGTFVGDGSTCTEPDWPWFTALVGARFKFHQKGTPAGKLTKNAREHLALQGLPDPWVHEDEWYEWEKNPADDPHIKVLLWVDEGSYSNKVGKHPVSWYRQFEGGRVFYTALGHTDASFNDAHFRRHLADGIAWAGRLGTAK